MVLTTGKAFGYLLKSSCRRGDEGKGRASAG